MNPQRRTYSTRGEKTRDLLIGLGIFFGANILLGSLAIGIAQLSNAPLQKNANVDRVFALVFFCLPPIANIAAWFYFLIRRRWIAIGMAAGLIASIACALIGFALLLASGFSLV